MALTQVQLPTLRAHVLASTDPAVVAARTDGATQVLADLYNLPSSPELPTSSGVWVWRTAVRKNEYTQDTSRDLTTFDWASTGGYIARSQGERDAWRELFNGGGRGDGAVNPSLANVRAAFTNIFSGTGAGAVANRNHLASMSKRRPTLAESLYIDTTGGNTGSYATPALLTFEGNVSDSDMQAVLAG